MVKFCTFVKSQELSARERLTMQPLTVIKEDSRGERKESVKKPEFGADKYFKHKEDQ